MSSRTDGLTNPRSVYVNGEKCFAEARILGIHVVHVVYHISEGWHINLIGTQAPDAVIVSLDASESIGAEF